MSKSRFAVFAVLALAAVSVSDPRHEARAQSGSVTTQTVGPNGSVSTTSRGSNGSTTQYITPQGNVITQSVLQDGSVVIQNITPDGVILSDDSGTARRSAAKRLPSPATLRAGLDVSVWDASQRGPLLTVAPEAVFPAWQKVVRKPLETFSPPQSPELLSGGRYRVPELAEYFGYRIVRLQGLSVLAPKEMVVLNTKPGKPDYFADLSPDEKLRMLQASLTEAQWKLLGSEGGLGTSDLSGKQRQLFIASLPNPFVIVKPDVYGSDDRSVGAKEKPIVLSGSQLSTVRLRINRAVAQVAVPFPGGGKSIYIGGDSIGTGYAAMNYSSFGSDGDTVFGQRIRRTVPNRLKPQQIDFAAPALWKPVSLIGLKTVGDLIERIRTTTGVEIYGDGRVAKRTLWVRSGETQTIRAAEALQALCWSLTGAVRYVSDGKSGVFLLTDDLEGIGSRLALLKDWAEAAQKQATQARIALQDTVRKRQPLQYIGFAAGDPNALGAKANKAVEDAWKMPKGRWQGASVPLAELSAQQQKSVAQEIGSFNANNERRAQFDGEALAGSETVAISVYIRPVFLVPGVGVVRDGGTFNSFGLLDTLLPPAPVSADPAEPASSPANLALKSILCVSPTTEDEARQAVDAAQERRLQQVWLVLPLLPTVANESETFLPRSKALLTAAVDEAKKAKSPVKVLAGVRLFRLPVSTGEASPSAEPDVTITGELPSEMAKRQAADSVAAAFARQMTYDWAAPGATDTTERITRRLSDIAATPEVSGLVLLDVFPPGYNLPLPDEANPFRLPHHEDFASVGYNPRERVAFIGSKGFDPVDITSDTFVGSVDLRLPFLESDVNSKPPDNSAANSAAEWNRFRSEILSKVLLHLYSPLMASLPKLEGGFPVYLQSLDTSGVIRGFSWWQKKAVLPRPDSSDPVLDFSEVPLRQALELLPAR